jgi:hypothetical protein
LRGCPSGSRWAAPLPTRRCPDGTLGSWLPPRTTTSSSEGSRYRYRRTRGRSTARPGRSTSTGAGVTSAARPRPTTSDEVGLNGEGRERVGLHDLRHSFVAIALANGVTLPEAAMLARHANPRVTLRCTRASPMALLGWPWTSSSARGSAPRGLIVNSPVRNRGASAPRGVVVLVAGRSLGLEP